MSSLVPVVAASAQVLPNVRTPIAPSQVTPRSLRPPLPALSAPLEIAQTTPAEAPPGADKIIFRVGAIVVDGGFPELAASSLRVLAPLEGRSVSVAQLYKAAGELEKVYSDAGYFLARVVIPAQRLADGRTFRIQVVDGFIERVDVKGVPRRVIYPVERVMRPIVGRRHLKLAEMERRLNAAGAIPGITLRSTLARGEVHGGARLILEGRHQLVGVSVGGDNRLGPSFRKWGLNVQAQINSPLGRGEQLYLFLASDPRLDRAFGRKAPRRAAGVGAMVPLSANGLVFNPEFTVSDTHPIPANPILATDGRLYRGALSLSQPLVDNAEGTLVGRGTIEFLSETQRLPVFGATLSKDRLTVLSANLSWRGRLWNGATISAEGMLAKGTRLFGARTPSGIAASATPTSRGSDPQFSIASTQAVVEQALGERSGLTLIARAQTSFAHVLPSSQLFDLSGLDSLSPLTAGALSSDGGASVRGELHHGFLVTGGTVRFQLSPYLFAAAARPHNVIADPFLPTRAYAFGAGVRIAGSPSLLGASPNLTLEYGHFSADRPGASSERLTIVYGVTF